MPPAKDILQTSAATISLIVLIATIWLCAALLTPLPAWTRAQAETTYGHSSGCAPKWRGLDLLNQVERTQDNYESFPAVLVCHYGHAQP